ncbi:MAG: four-carbon acid sugar kinase family protein [Actinopolymorphaceae bacterium]
MTERLVAAFYGDDFTGASDALGQFHRWGLRTILLFDVPGGSTVRDLGDDYDVIGVAGVARSLPPALMEAEVAPALEAFRSAGVRVVQYKMCSTADSSPRLGSLGRAVEIGRSVFGERPVPLLVAQPELGRYTAFGHHFAVEQGVVHRLDRQPTMSHHPATPMTESDLRIHLRQQTALPVAGLDMTVYELPADKARERYHGLLAERPGVVAFDAVTQRQLPQAADLMVTGSAGDTLYALGSGGLSYGLGAQLAGRPVGAGGVVRTGAGGLGVGAAGLTGAAATLVVSGSCSGQTATQISYALARGWEGVRVDVDADHGADTSRAALGRLRDRVLAALRHGGRVIAYTAAPTARPRRGTGNGTAVDQIGSIGTTLGHVVREAVACAGVRRIVVAGGDTSGRVMRELGAQGAEVQSFLGPGAVLCRLRSPDSAVHGVTVLLKGGQIGPADLLERVRLGTTSHDPVAGSPGPVTGGSGALADEPGPAGASETVSGR